MQKELLKMAFWLFYYVKQHFSVANLGVLDQLKWPFLDSHNLLTSWGQHISKNLKKLLVKIHWKSWKPNFSSCRIDIWPFSDKILGFQDFPWILTNNFLRFLLKCWPHDVRRFQESRNGHLNCSRTSRFATEKCCFT